MKRHASLLIALLTLASCQSAPRYLVTVTPIDVGVAPGLCVAVDPRDPHGVWWWQAGSAGCASRSTGPALFHPDGATVARAADSGSFAIAFRLGTHSDTRPWIDVTLTVTDAAMRSPATGAEVSVARRGNLDIPEG